MEDKVFSIIEITRIIKRCLEESRELNNIWLKGELSNVTYHSSGHIYCTLKDKDAVISSVFFKYANKKLNFKLEEGMSIFVYGRINVFEKRGGYQFIITEAILEGIGELQRRIEYLKKKLLNQGLFDDSYKKDIPFLPRRIGIVTSPTGAAFRDILKVGIRRFPNIEIILAPVKVQGEGADSSIARGIEELNNPQWDIDVIIAGRGGGSFEDLMAFNEEIVVRAFFDSRVPIVSAVGHQIDHPLSDDVADYAASTPSAAAEIVIPEKEQLQNSIDILIRRSYHVILMRIKEIKARVEGILERRIFQNPMDIIYNKELLLADIEHRLVLNMKEKIILSRNSLSMILDIKILIRNIIMEKAHRLSIVKSGIESMSPENVMRRGYSLAISESGGIIKSVTDLKRDDILNLFLFEGSANCTVNSTKKGEKFGKKETSEE